VVKARLTKRTVESVPIGSNPVIVWDTEVPGFGLKVTPSGRRVYFIYYRTSAGTQRRPTIGRHGKVTPDEARQVARQWLAQSVTGVDVSAARQERSGPRVRAI
jgi:Arm DNA-binding domain